MRTVAVIVAGMTPFAGHFAMGMTGVGNPRATGNDVAWAPRLGVSYGAFDVAQVEGADKLRASTSRNLLRKWEAMARDYRLEMVAPVEFALLAGRYPHEPTDTTVKGSGTDGK